MMTGLPSVRLPSQRWLIVFMCFLAVAINYIDRANLGVAVPMIQREYGIDPALMGLILSGFFWSYVLMQLPGGWLIDRFGSRATYTVATLIMSMATLATAFAGGVASLIACRLMLGIGEAFCYPVNASVTSLWFRRSERGLATGVCASGSRVGSAMTLPLVAFLIANFGWREAFLVTGAIGLVWMVVWYCAAIFPHTLAFNASAVPEKTARVLEAIGAAAVTDEAAVLEHAQRFCIDLGVETRLSRLGVPEDDLDAMAAEAHAIRRLLDNNPRELSREAIGTLYRAAY